MKRNTTLFIAIVVCGLFSVNRSEAQTDSSLITRDTIYASKANYIGQPFSKLVNSLKGAIVFSTPCGAQTYTSGVVLCKNFIIYVHPKQGFPLWGLQLTFTNNVSVDLAQYFKISNSEWGNLMIGALYDQNIVSISKF